ncbi:MAG: hypothetical protein KGS09_01480 [Nitrospirae bacterium]|nr:hypothetical protein [Nitrospirota bacterium]MDE3052034.1 hypothetical protein [Nitrospirota bacterium]
MEKMMMFHVPEDEALLAAFGELTLRHEHLNHILRMTIKTLANLDVNEALGATAYVGSSKLRDRIRKLAKQRLGEGQALLRLEAIVERCRQATEKRNDYVHSVVAKELDGEPRRRSTDHSWQPVPTTPELKSLSADIRMLTRELNDARLEGFLAQALSKRPCG